MGEKMGKLSYRVIFSILLIGLGVLILLDNLNILPIGVSAGNWFWLVVFGGAGLAFLVVFLRHQAENWWAVIPSFTFLGLAFVVGEFLPRRLEDLNGAVFLGMLGLSFWVIYALRSEHWWAVIPGGTLVALAIAISISTFTDSGILTGAALLLGLGLTFLLVYLRPDTGQRRSWPLYPASILGVMGLLLFMGQGWLANFVVPFALILLGSVVVFSALRR
jgi:hypothetical protein